MIVLEATFVDERLTRVEVPSLHSGPNRLTTLQSRFVTLDTATLSFSRTALESRELTAPKVWYANCPSTMGEEEQHAEDFCR